MTNLGIYEVRRGNQTVRLKLNERDAVRLGARLVEPEASTVSGVKKSAAVGNKARPAPGNKTTEATSTDATGDPPSDEPVSGRPVSGGPESARRPGGGRGSR